MDFLKKSNFKKDYEVVRHHSVLVEKKLAKLSKKNERKIEKLTLGELQDLNEILKIADFILCKYENKKEIRSLLRDFVDIIDSSSNSIRYLDDEIEELVLNAEDAIKRIKEIQSNVSDSFSFEKHKKDDNPEKSKCKIGANNLTKSSIPVYTQGYQHKSGSKTEQVV